MTTKPLISLTDDQEANARALVASGQLPEPSRRSSARARDVTVRRQDAELQALRSLIDQRRAETIVDLDEGKVDTTAMLDRQLKARATL